MDTQVQLNIDVREPFADGAGFGSVGPYERLMGRVDFAVDPDAPAYQSVVDLEFAPRNSSGMVEFSTDLFILKPVDLSNGNRRLIYDVNNRGNKTLIQNFNDAPRTEANASGNDPSSLEDAGNGFLMRRGYTIVCSAWQGNILPIERRLTMRLPVARENGNEIRGSEKERIAGGDPRPSVEERYRSKAHYVREVALAAQRLIEQRLLLEEDADRYIDEAIKAAPWSEPQ